MPLKVTITCQQCGTIAHNKQKGAKYCSRECGYKSLVKPNKIYNCLECSKALIKWQTKYCSKSCANTASNRGNPKYKKYLTPESLRLAINAKNAERRATKLNQTPKWFDKQAVDKFYAECPDGYHVDHIWPLTKGGLHSLENLQYLEANENMVKTNKTPCEWTKYRIKQGKTMPNKKCTNCNVYDAKEASDWCVKCHACCKPDGSPNDQLLEDLAMIKRQVINDS